LVVWISATALLAVGFEGPLLSAKADLVRGTNVQLPTICDRPDDSVLRDSPTAEGGYPQAAEWIAGDVGQQEVSRLNAALERYDGSLVGATRDHSAQEIIVVVDSQAPSADVDRLLAEIASLQLKRKVAVRSSCRPKRELQQVERDLAEMAKQTNGLAFSTDAAAGVVTAVVGTEVDKATLEARFGSRVRVGVAGGVAVFAGNRFNDSSPHYGDTAISPGFVAPTCTSNFSYTSNVYGTRTTASADHCGSSAWWSSSNHVGDTVFTSFSQDVQMIYAAGQNYTNKIYVDPCSPCVRTVVGKASPGVNELVCVGGQVSLAQCGIEVISTNATYCPPGYACTYNMLQTFALQNEYATFGDSGGIVYQRSGASNALAVGMIRGGAWVFGGLSAFHVKVSTIESTISATLATSP
jgi:hypothetical protein